MQLPQPELAADITSALKTTEEIASEDCMPAKTRTARNLCHKFIQ